MKGYSDTILTIIVFFIVIVCYLAFTLLGNYVVPLTSDLAPGATNTTINESWNNTKTFTNNVAPVLFFIFLIGGVVLTIFLQSNPVYLLVFLFINLAALLIYEPLSNVLTTLLASPLNTGDFQTAGDFYINIGPKLIVVINMLLAIFLLGKRAVGGGT